MGCSPSRSSLLVKPSSFSTPTKSPLCIGSSALTTKNTRSSFQTNTTEGLASQIDDRKIIPCIQVTTPFQEPVVIEHVGNNVSDYIPGCQNNVIVFGSLYSGKGRLFQQLSDDFNFCIINCEKLAIDKFKKELIRNGKRKTLNDEHPEFSGFSNSSSIVDRDPQYSYPVPEKKRISTKDVLQHLSNNPELLTMEVMCLLAVKEMERFPKSTNFLIDVIPNHRVLMENTHLLKNCAGLLSRFDRNEFKSRFHIYMRCTEDRSAEEETQVFRDVDDKKRERKKRTVVQHNMVQTIEDVLQNRQKHVKITRPCSTPQAVMYKQVREFMQNRGFLFAESHTRYILFCSNHGVAEFKKNDLTELGFKVFNEEGVLGDRALFKYKMSGKDIIKALVHEVYVNDSEKLLPAYIAMMMDLSNLKDLVKQLQSDSLSRETNQLPPLLMHEPSLRKVLPNLPFNATIGTSKESPTPRNCSNRCASKFLQCVYTTWHDALLFPSKLDPRICDAVASYLSSCYTECK